MPRFCRHNRLLQNCPICSREEAIEGRPLVTSSAPRSSLPRAAEPRARSRSAPRRTAEGRGRGGVTVRRLRDSVDDGYRSPLIPGVKSTQDANSLAEELAFAATRLRVLSTDPPGLYRELADDAADLEERTWLAFLIAYLYPLESSEPFAAIESATTSWEDADRLELGGEVQTGPRTAHDPARGTETIDAYRAWAQRAGGQRKAFEGEAAWSPERRFARVFERLALPGLHRDARFELLLSLGALGLYELEPSSLAFGGADAVTLGAKRAFAIGDQLLLDRRAAALADACGVPLGAVDLALYNWERGERASGGLGPEPAPGEAELDSVLSALDL